MPRMLVVIDIQDALDPLSDDGLDLYRYLIEVMNCHPLLLSAAMRPENAVFCSLDMETLDSRCAKGAGRGIGCSTLKGCESWSRMAKDSPLSFTRIDPCYNLQELSKCRFW